MLVYLSQRPKKKRLLNLLVKIKTKISQFVIVQVKPA